MTKIRNNVLDVIENASNTPNKNVKKKSSKSDEVINLFPKSSIIEVCDTIINFQK